MGKEIPPNALEKQKLEESCIKNTMSKVQIFAGIHQSLPFTEFDYIRITLGPLKKTKRGGRHKLLPLHKVAVNFGVVSKSLRPEYLLTNFEMIEQKLAEAA